MIRAVVLAAAAVLALAVGGCFPQRGPGTELASPRPESEWTALLADLRAVEARIGYAATRNFGRYSEELKSFPFCGHAPKLKLPYSYEDPAIRWYKVDTDEECRSIAEDTDVTFGASEAIGEREAPVTPKMLVAPLDRFVYVVFHEDCHEQFDLPYGIEEALCNLIAFEAMTAFGEQRFKPRSAERAAIVRYVRDGETHSRTVVEQYDRLAALYARYERSAMSPQQLLRERERLFRSAERRLAWTRGSMNNVWLANAMTYSRHYALLAHVHEALGRDLKRTMAFFRHVDRTKPTPAEVLASQGLSGQDSDGGLAFVRGYEAAIVRTIERTLESAAF